MFGPPSISFSARPVVFRARPWIGTVGPKTRVLQSFKETKLAVQQQHISNAELYRAKRQELTEHRRADQRQLAHLQRRNISAEQVNRPTPTAVKYIVRPGARAFQVRGHTDATSQAFKEARKRTRRLAGDEDAARKLYTEGFTINEILSDLIVKGPHHGDYPDLLQELFKHLWKTCPLFNLLQRQFQPPTPKYAAFKSQIGWDWGKLIEVYRTVKGQASSLGTDNVVSVVYNALTAFAGEIELVLDGYNTTSDDMDIVPDGYNATSDDMDIVVDGCNTASDDMDGVHYTSSIDEGALDPTEDVEMNDGELDRDESVQRTLAMQGPAEARARANTDFMSGFPDVESDAISEIRSSIGSFSLDSPRTTSLDPTLGLFKDVKGKEVPKPVFLQNMSQLVAAFSLTTTQEGLEHEYGDILFEMDEYAYDPMLSSNCTDWVTLACVYILSAHRRSIARGSQMRQHEVIRDFEANARELRADVEAKAAGNSALKSEPIIARLLSKISRAMAVLAESGQVTQNF